MKRSGSKLIAKAGSVKNINKAGFRFAFELQLESCDQLLTNSDVVCTWERGPKVVSTAPMKVDTSKRMVTFNGASLRQEVTMFKKKKSDAAYEPKVYRLTIRSGSETGKIVGKIDLNFTDYIEVPSFSKRIAAPLSSGSRLVMRVNSRFLGEAEKGKKGKGKHDDTSSTVSGSDSGVDGYSPEEAEELEERNKDEQDLDDLVVEDAPKQRPRGHGVGAGDAAPYAPQQLSASSGPRVYGGDNGGARHGNDNSAGGRHDARTTSADSGYGVGGSGRGRPGGDAGGYMYGGDGRADRYGTSDSDSGNGGGGRYGRAGKVSAVGAVGIDAGRGNGRTTANDYGNPHYSSGAVNPYGAAEAAAVGGVSTLRRKTPHDEPDAPAPTASSGFSTGGNTARRYAQTAAYGQSGRHGGEQDGSARHNGYGNPSRAPAGGASYGQPADWRKGSGTSPEEDLSSRQEMERLRADNKALRRANDQLNERLAEVESGAFSNNSESMEALVHENRTLRRDIEELEGRLSREPVYADVVKELREAKMALAILTLERDELQQKVRSGAPGSGIAARNLL